jgi:hypothetical protein
MNQLDWLRQCRAGTVRRLVKAPVLTIYTLMLLGDPELRGLKLESYVFTDQMVDRSVPQYHTVSDLAQLTSDLHELWLRNCSAYKGPQVKYMT